MILFITYMIFFDNYSIIKEKIVLNKDIIIIINNYFYKHQKIEVTYFWFVITTKYNIDILQRIIIDMGALNEIVKYIYEYDNLFLYNLWLKR